MDNKIQRFYDALYGHSKGLNSSFGKPDKELAKFLNTADLKGTKALDLGCGDGRNAAFLASKNFAVFGIDNSASGLRKLKNLIRNTVLAKNIHLKMADLRKIKLNYSNYFDLVVCTLVFHEIGARGVRNIIKQAKLATRPLGINYLAFHTPREGTYVRRECYYPVESAIIRQYKGWKIIKAKKVLMAHEHLSPYSKNMTRHKHYVCHLFLQKPKS